MENAITSHLSFFILPLQTLPYNVTQTLSNSYFTTFMPWQKQKSIIFSSFYLTITIVTHQGSYPWCNIHISKYPNVQIVKKTRIEPTIMRSKIHLRMKLSPHHCTQISESNNHSTIADVLYLKKKTKQNKQNNTK